MRIDAAGDIALYIHFGRPHARLVALVVEVYKEDAVATNKN